MKLVSFMRRAEGLNHEQFVRHWTENHTPLALEHHPGLWNYTQNIVRRGVHTRGTRHRRHRRAALRAPATTSTTGSSIPTKGRQVIIDDVARFMGRPGSGSGLMTELPILTVASP